MRKLIFSAALSLGIGVSAVAHASGDVVAPIDIKWPFEGIFGTFDRGALKRGSQVFFEICNGCHSMDMMSYRNLLDIGLDEKFVKDLAAGYEVQDGPNDEGEMFARPARLSDRFVGPFANEKAARYANGGAYPPDLSVITKARAGGPDYVYSLLVGYEDAPEHVQLADGTNYNKYFPGHQVFMAPPLFDDAVEFADGTPATLDQEARDVVTFLSWAAEPELEARKTLGVKVLLYLIVLTAMLHALKRRIWSRICLDEYTHGPYVEQYQEELDKHKLPG